MSVTGWKTPGTAASVDRDSKTAWESPNNAKTDDGNYAVCSSAAKNTYGDWLRLTNYDFTNSDIPQGASIDGIEAKVERMAGTIDLINDSAFYLRKTSGQVGSNKASAVYWSTTEESVTYGGSTDNWNAGLADTDIKQSDFGVDLSAYTGDDDMNASIDVIWLRVYYSTGGKKPVWSMSKKGRGRARAHPTLNMG